jgi:hypothetical protein
MLQANRELTRGCIMKNPVAGGKWFVPRNCLHEHCALNAIIISLLRITNYDFINNKKTRSGSI